jgi:tetratricopeptide (TPR) repeat protein
VWQRARHIILKAIGYTMLPLEKDVIDRALESGDPATAEEAFHEIDVRLQSLTSAREKADLLMRKAVLYEKVGRIDDARKQLRAALAEAPDEPDVRLQFDYIDGSIYHQEENFGEAFTRLTAVLSKYHARLALPDFRFVYEDIQQQRAFELFRLKKFQEAVPLFKECLAFDMKPEDRSSALANLGICYVKLKRYEDAKDYLLQACKMGVTKDWEGHVHFYLAFTYAQLQLLRESKREFQLCEERAAEYQLPLERLYVWLSRICGLLGEKAESERYARLARPI